jgi:hypothetical protein
MNISTPFSILSCLVIVGNAACSSSSTTPTSTTDAGTDSPSTCDKVPASGYTQVVPPSTDPNLEAGDHTAMTLNKDGYPVIAYSVHDSSGKKSESYYVVRWDPCLGAWSTPLKFDSGNGLEATLPTRDISIALDPVDGRIGIAYVRDYLIAQPNSTRAAFVTFSTDGGKSFSPGVKVSIHGVEQGKNAGDIEDVDNPAIALRNGKTYVAYNQTYEACGASKCQDGIVLASGGSTGAPFTQELMQDGVDPTYNGFALSASFPIGLAVDSAGVPAVAAHVAPATAYNMKFMFFRPGKIGTLIMDSANQQNDSGSSALVFDGTKARVLTRLNAGKNPNGNLLFLSSTDGNTWSSPVALPLENAVNTPNTQALMSDGKGGVAVVAQTSTTPDSPAAGPKFWRSSDLTSFAIAGTGPTSGPVPTGKYMSGALTNTGKVRMAFFGDVPVNVNQGVVYWSEP